MIRRLLVANRGEIACRIIATARAMGIGTVAVHSEADAGAAHVGMADAAVCIGPAPAAQSYLDGARVIAAAGATGADAIHPGYGFLSENPDFAEAVAAAGLTFVGPPAAAIRAMGLKDAAKAAMRAAGVPVVPGDEGADQSPEALAAAAARIGYPVMIKARAGGGGKGMRRVDAPEGFAAALAGARAEAAAAFGDPAVLIEKCIATPRHIEIQVFADAHGNAVHLGERDCSLQRRHQKVIEEAPAPGMTPELRAAMGAAAVEAARAIGYVGAGTVEFIADGSGPLRPDGFWFMEMNTRLQVEHPVTEAVTGTDLVEWQLRVAAGERLPATQEALSISGHAVEARLYAEDAARGFLPAPGRLAHLAFPPAAAFAPGALRIDSGVRAGDTVSAHYDPMIAKLVAHGPDRATALARLAAALAATEVAGTVTNRDFLHRLVSHPKVRAGAPDTGFIDRAGGALTDPPACPPDVAAAAALALAGRLDPPAGPDPWDALAGFRLWGAARLHMDLRAGDTRHPVELTLHPDGQAETAEGARLAPAGPGIVAVTSGGVARRLRVILCGRTATVLDGGATHVLAEHLPGGRPEAASAEAVLRAPMPGLVTRVAAAAGQGVAAGAALVALEAMKMEYLLCAPRDGTVAEVLVAVGAQVAEGAALLRLEDGEVVP